MRLYLNETEVIDGICVFIANLEGGNPENVDVQELNYHKNGTFSSKADYFESRYSLRAEQICEGIRQFLEEYHSFNPIVTNVELQFTEDEGVWAEVFVNE